MDIPSACVQETLAQVSVVLLDLEATAQLVPAACL
jgi:hypothetical protein